MNITKKMIIKEASESRSMEDFANRLKIENTAEAISGLGEVCPGFEKLIRRNFLTTEIKRLADEGKLVEAKALRKEMIILIDEINDLGLKVKKSEMEVGIESVKEKKESKKELKAEPINSEEIQCEPARAMVLGYVPEETFLKRRLVYVKLIPGLFGDGVVTRDTLKRYTIHKGIINHSDVRQGEAPSKYWAVMDAMSELSIFTKEQVVTLAVKRIIEGGSRESKNLLASGCGIAYDVLKTHQSHPTKKKTGMTHICEDQLNEKGEKVVAIRGRRSEETMEYFEKKKSSLKKALKDGKPLQTVCLKDPV